MTQRGEKTDAHGEELRSRQGKTYYGAQNKQDIQLRYGKSKSKPDNDHKQGELHEPPNDHMQNDYGQYEDNETSNQRHH